MTVSRWTARGLTLASLAVIMLGSAYAQQMTAPVAQPAPPAPTTALTVDQAVIFALRNNPSITLNAQNVQIAREQVGSARSNGLPNVSLSATSTYSPISETFAFQGAPAGGNRLNTSAMLTVSQPVWPSSRWRAPVAAARANEGFQEENLTRTQQQVAFLTRQAFYQLLGTQELLSVAQYSVTVAEEQLRLANATFDAGTAPFLDVEQARASLADAQVSLVRAQNDVDVARATLVVQLGLPAGTPLTIVAPTTLPTAPDQVDPLIAEAIRSRPEMAQLNYQRQQIRANIDLIKLQQRPLVTMEGIYNRGLTGLGSDTSAFGIAANLAFTIYNGKKTRYDVAAAQTQLAQVDTSSRQLELGISLDVRQAWLNLQNALKQLTAAEEQRKAAESAVTIAEVRYREGEGIQLELEQARLRSTQALTSLAQARFQAQTAAAQLLFAIGAPVPTTDAEAVPAPAPAVPAP